MIFYIGLALVIVSFVSIAAAYLPQKITKDGVYRLYQKNLLSHNQDISAIREDILSLQDIDFITLQEVSKSTDELLPQLVEAFPHQHMCNVPPKNDLAILSRWPIIKGQTVCHNAAGIAAMQVQTPAGPIWIISLHHMRPYPYNQARHTHYLLGSIEALKGNPKVIGGDFNMVPWSYTLKAFETVSNTHHARPAVNSFKLPYISLTIPIDHVLVPKNSKARTQRRGKKGSDHFGVIAEFNLPYAQ